MSCGLSVFAMFILQQPWNGPQKPLKLKVQLLIGIMQTTCQSHHRHKLGAEVIGFEQFPIPLCQRSKNVQGNRAVSQSLCGHGAGSPISIRPALRPTDPDTLRIGLHPSKTEVTLTRQLFETSSVRPDTKLQPRCAGLFLAGLQPWLTTSTG